jgi:hypothetical protein
LDEQMIPFLKQKKSGLKEDFRCGAAHGSLVE